MDWLTIVGIIIGAILLVIYSMGVMFFFMNIFFEDSISRAFGWGGLSIFSIAIQSLLWPLLLPLGIIVGFIEDWNYKRKHP